MRAVNGPDVIELGRLHFHAEALAMLFVEPWFGVKAVNLGDPSIHIEENNALCLACEMGLAGGKRPFCITSCLTSQERIKGYSAKSDGTALQHLAPAEWPGNKSSAMHY
jgi:hypothetical protein